ncbi:MAG: response regulator transcription factor [Verrucomicrobia bacterium]|nr:response regulator transcription factor [Verrucomicrobiota bacterium]
MQNVLSHARQPTPAPLQAKPAKEPGPAQGPTVFLVEDDAVVCRGTARLLRLAGYHTVAFATAEEFLACSRSPGPACLVLDVRLPGLNGLELQQRLASADRQLPTVFITGLGDVPTSVWAMKAGAVDFLPKPFEDEELLEAVARALAKGHAEQKQRSEAAAIRQRLLTLTTREREVLSQVVVGRLNKQIADHLGLVEKTIKVHRARVMRKMGAQSLADLVRTMVMASLADSGQPDPR